MSLSKYFQKMQCKDDKLFSILKDTEFLSKNVTWYRVATSSEYIGMSIKFYKVVQNLWGGDMYTESSPFVSRTSSGHWWLTAFKPYFVNKENIIMKVGLTFPDNTMESAYQVKLNEKKYNGYNIWNITPSQKKYCLFVEVKSL